MKAVIIVSKCTKVIKFNQVEAWYHFHFKGVCAGEILKRVVLKGRKDFKLTKGEEYLMYVSLIEIKEGTLKGTILKAKLLSDCWDRS